jgi:hypothetical protein
MAGPDIRLPLGSCILSPRVGGCSMAPLRMVVSIMGRAAICGDFRVDGLGLDGVAAGGTEVYSATDWKRRANVQEAPCQRIFTNPVPATAASG